MALTYGFYNSINHDRTYNADQVSALFDGLIHDGVFDSIGDILATVPGDGLQVLVKSGKAWFNHTWTINDAIIPLTIQPADVTLTRIDAVVLEVNHTESVRANSIKVKTGIAATTPTKPAMTNTDTIHQYPLAYVTVRPGAVDIKAADVENNVGKSSCPFVTGIIQSTDIDDLFNQWEGQFDAWFENLKAQLTDDVVANLQRQIDEKLNIADKATAAEVTAGTNDTHYITPKLLKAGVGESVMVPNFGNDYVKLQYPELDLNKIAMGNIPIKSIMYRTKSYDIYYMGTDTWTILKKGANTSPVSVPVTNWSSREHSVIVDYDHDILYIYNFISSGNSTLKKYVLNTSSIKGVAWISNISGYSRDYRNYAISDRYIFAVGDVSYENRRIMIFDIVNKTFRRLSASSDPSSGNSGEEVRVLACNDSIGLIYWGSGIKAVNLANGTVTTENAGSGFSASGRWISNKNLFVLIFHKQADQGVSCIVWQCNPSTGKKITSTTLTTFKNGVLKPNENVYNNAGDHDIIFDDGSFCFINNGITFVKMNSNNSFSILYSLLINSELSHFDQYNNIVFGKLGMIDYHYYSAYKIEYFYVLKNGLFVVMKPDIFIGDMADNNPYNRKNVFFISDGGKNMIQAIWGQYKQEDTGDGAITKIHRDIYVIGENTIAYIPIFKKGNIPLN